VRIAREHRLNSVPRNLGQIGIVDASGPDSPAIRRGGFPKRGCGAGRSRRRCPAWKGRLGGVARSPCGAQGSLRPVASAHARMQLEVAASWREPSSLSVASAIVAAYELSQLSRGRRLASSAVAKEKCDQDVTTKPWNTPESSGAPRNTSPAQSRRSGSTKGKGRHLPALLPMRPTRIELATFGLKDRRSLVPVKGPLTTELRAPVGV
jgi:hypothetical protein